MTVRVRLKIKFAGTKYSTVLYSRAITSNLSMAEQIMGPVEPPKPSFQAGRMSEQFSCWLVEFIRSIH